ncbi:CoA-binding protein [Romboutsia sp.]|uniref:CoA-binding protein n=1 Tax=Romboutsia sp. TaxID=1965302 RepID=UPI003F35B939
MNLLRYNSWAVLIKDKSQESIEYKVIEALMEKKHTVVGIDANKNYIDGVEIYESLKDVPYNIDVVAILEQSIDVYSILEEMELLDIKNIWIDKDSCNEQILKISKDMKLNVENKLNLYKELK